MYPTYSPFSRSIISSSSWPQSINSLSHSYTHINSLSHSLYFYFIFEYILLTMLWQLKRKWVLVVSDSLRVHGLYSPWNSPGQNTRVGNLPPLQGIFPTQRLTQISHIAGRFFTNRTTREVIAKGGQKRVSGIYVRVPILPETSFLPRLPHKFELSSMSYTVGYCWLSILNTEV